MKWSYGLGFGFISICLSIGTLGIVGIARAQSSTETVLSSSLIGTRYRGGGILGCDSDTWDNRWGLGVTPKGRSGDLEWSHRGLFEAGTNEEQGPKFFRQSWASVLEAQRGRHGISLKGSYDRSHAVRWGCVASLTERLRREQNIQEDLEVAGDTIRSGQGDVQYHYAGDAWRLSGSALRRLELAAYRRQLTELFHDFVMIHHRYRWSNGILVGEELMREQRFVNRRLTSNLNVKLNGRTSTELGVSWQGRGERERRVGGQADIAHQFTRSWTIGSSMSRFVAEKSPRFNNNRFVLRAIGSHGRIGLSASMGRVQTDSKGGNANNIFGLNLDRRWGRRQLVTIRLEHGTEFVAIIRTSRTGDVSYEYVFPKTAVAARKLSFGLKYGWNEIASIRGDKTTLQTVIVGLVGEF